MQLLSDHFFENGPDLHRAADRTPLALFPASG